MNKPSSRRQRAESGMIEHIYSLPGRLPQMKGSQLVCAHKPGIHDVIRAVWRDDHPPRLSRIGRYFRALLRFERVLTGSPVSSIDGYVARSSSKNTRPSSRAMWTPRQ